MAPQIEGDRPVVKLVALQSTSFCNIDCTYCYLPHRHLPNRMSLDKIRQIFDSLRCNFYIGEKLTVIWHCGEPLLQPPDYYAAAMAQVKTVIPGFVNLRFEFQTNAMLLSKQWLPILQADNVGIGVSVDGPKSVHDANRRHRNGKGSHDLTMKGIKLLQSHGIEFSTICVLNEEFLGFPELYDRFFSENGIKRVSFNIPNLEGVSRLGFSYAEASIDLLAEFYRYFVRGELDGTDMVRVFQISEMIHRMREFPATSYLEHKAFEIVTVNANGEFSTFSPELNDFSHAKFGSFNVGKLSPDYQVDLSSLWSFQAEVSSGVKKCKNLCRYFPVCGGGIPSTKFFDTGTFDVAEHRTCRSAIQLLADVIAQEMLMRRMQTHDSQNLSQKG